MTRHLFNSWILSFILLFSSLLFVEIYYESEYAKKSQFNYQQAYDRAQNLLDSSLRANHEKIALTALYLSKNDTIKTALIKQNPKLIKFDSNLLKNDEFGSLGKVLVQVIDKNGNSFYRSWSSQTGAYVLNLRKDLKRFFLVPKVTNTLSVGQYNLSLKSIIPVFDGTTFIGAFEAIGLLNGVVLDMKRSNINTMILLNERYRPQMLSQSEQVYIGNQMLVSGSQEMKQSYIQNKLERALTKQNYFVDSLNNQFISSHNLINPQGNILAKAVFFTDLTPILSQNKPSVALFYAFIFGTFGAFWVLLFSVINYKKIRAKEDQILTMQYEVERLDHKMLNLDRFWQTVMDRLNDSVIVVNRNQKNMLFNGAAKSLLRKRKYQDKGCAQCVQVQNNKLDCPEHIEQCSIRDSFKLKKPVTTIEKIKVNGLSKYYEFRATPTFDNLNNVEQVVEIGHDITEYVNAKQQLEEQKDSLNKLAFYDSLTTLPNRRLFSDRLQQAMNLSQRTEKGMALMFMDLDFFKQVNDTHGHEIGDKILIECAKRLKKSVRKIDTVSRLGGDEFTIIIEQFESREVVADIVQSILNIINKPFNVAGIDFYMTTSIGISLYPDDGQTMTDLIKNADIAMYQAKELGRNNYAFYNQEMTKKAVERINLENELRVAIEEHQFKVHYQPQFNLNDHTICGFEALVRWQHPTKGLLLPSNYIKLAEETGMINAIGEQVMLEAMSTISNWHQMGITKERMAINISAKQFANKKLLKTVQKNLYACKCLPEWVEFEITETAVMKDIGYATSVLTQLKMMGISIAIDDFGTGYSSLVQLKRLPIDKIKIDQSFIRHLPDNSDDLQITKTIISMAKGLKVATIAEGIENPQQSECIQIFGCSHAQGFLFCQPKIPISIERLLREQMVGTQTNLLN